MKYFSLLLLSVVACTAQSVDDQCLMSDAKLIHLKDVICESLGCETVFNVTAQKDWPNQAIYMKNLLRALINPDTCLDTPVAKAVVAWLEITDAEKSLWWWTWEVFQVQYYDMPRNEGDRIESPATLGRKCWAFAYLTQIWPDIKPALETTMDKAGLNMKPYIDEYDYAIELTMPLCNEVMANCFVNASYDPSRNGTCPGPVGEFYVGFQWENGCNEENYRGDRVDYPFPTYHQTERMHEEWTFAVNTALNYII